MAEEDCKAPPTCTTEYVDKYIPYPWMSQTQPQLPPKEEPKEEPLDLINCMSYEDAVKILEPVTRKSPMCKDKTEYIDNYILHRSKTPSGLCPGERPVDMLTGRPRTPNDQYTVLTETQIKNLNSDPSPFFSLEGPSEADKNAPLVRPAPIARHATNTSQYLFRDTPSKSHPHCWIDDQWMRDPPQDHNTCRLGASLRWGPSKTGERTISHFHQEDVHRYLNIDVYKRPPTNIPSMVVMKHGRPSEGYYQQRNPSFNTWFGSTHKLNETNVLTTIRPKTMAEYKELKTIEQDYGKHRESKWPEISEYTDKYLLNSLPETTITGMEARKEFHREQRRQKAMSMLSGTCPGASKEQPVPA